MLLRTLRVLPATAGLIVLKLTVLSCFIGLSVSRLSAQGINCNNPLALSCGVAIITTTTGGINDWAALGYPCVINANTYNGEDRIFRLNLPKDDWYDIIVDGLSANLDLFLMFNVCSDDGFKECLGASTKTGTSSEKIGPVYLRSADQIFAIVDGVNSATRGNFRIRLTCYNKPSTGSCTPSYSAFNHLNLHENFELYTTGGISTKTTMWKKFAANSADANVSTLRAHNGSKSLMIRRTTSAPDVLFPLGNIDHGRYRLQWKMFVDNGAAAYYNLQHKFSGGHWAYEVFFNTNGTGSVKYLNADKHSFKYKQNVWISVTQIIDIDKDIAELFIDGKFVGKWTWSAGTVNSSPVSSNKLGAVNFYANTASHYFIDDLCMYRTGCFDCAVTSEDVEVCIYPGNTHVNADCATCAGYTVEEWGANNCGPNYDKVTFEFGQVCGQPMDELLVPVKVYNFSNITAASFTLEVLFPEVVQIIGMATVNLFGDIGFHETTPGKVFTFTWLNEEGLSYPDGTTLFSIGVKLLGSEGMTENLHIVNHPVGTSVYQNGNLVDHFMRLGSVCIGTPGKFVEGEARTFTNKKIGLLGIFGISNPLPPAAPSIYEDYGGVYGYRLNGLSNTDNLQVYCFKLVPDNVPDSGIREGLDLGDLIVLRNHIQGRTLFNKPEQYIAADVMRSNSINNDDYLLLKSVLLGEKQSFESNNPNATDPLDPWVFIPTTETLTIDKAINHTYQTFHEIKPFTASLTGVDFWGIKLGDLNFSYAASTLVAPLSTRQTTDLSLPALSALPQGLIALPLAINHGTDVQGLDLELRWDPATAEFITLTDVHELFPLDQWSVDDAGTSSGLLKIKWLGADQPVNVQGRIASLQFKALGHPGEMTAVEITSANIYDHTGQVLSAALSHGSINITNKKTPTQNEVVLYPNPAQGYLNISGLSEGDEVEYLINTLGQKTQLRWTGQTGYVLNTSSFNSGMYYLVTRKSGQRIVKPVIIR